MRIRATTAADLPILQDIERAAGLGFRELGMAEIADDEPFSLEVLSGYLEAGRSWVAVDDADRPVGYLIGDIVDGNFHVEQVSVHPDAARQGVGRSLIDHVSEATGIHALTLTTFTNVPWNAPYYQRCGFRMLGEDELTPGLQDIRRREAEHGLDRWPRTCMRKDVP